MDIEPEFVDDEYVVLMPSVNTSEEDFEKTLNVLKNVERFAEATSSDAIFVKKHERVMSVREAMLAESESINAEEATGRICAASTVSCPPAVPIVISGERITNEDIALFKKYGVNNVSVIKI